MAGPSIVVRILGDLKSFGSSLKDAGKEGASAGSKIHEAFSGALGVLNRTGVLGPFGEALDQIDGTLENIGKHGKDIGTGLMAVGGTVAGIGLGLAALGSKEKASQQQLQAAIEATGKSYGDYSEDIEKAVKHNEHFGQSTQASMDALRVLTQATHDPAKAIELLGTATNIAAAKHEDLATAAEQLGKVYNGNTKLLKEYGISIDKTTGKTKDGKTATQALADVTKGQAAAAVDTFSGKLKVLGVQVEDQAAAFGAKYGPAITAAGSAMTILGGIVKSTQGIMEAQRATQEAATAATEATTVAEEGATAAGIGMMATMGLVVLAVLALVAVGYVIYRNWSTIWAGIKAAVKAVWDWIRVNWPLLLGILLGPIGIAVALIVKYWSQIKAGAASVLTWLRANWPLILAILTGPIGLAVLAVARNWQTIKDGASAAVAWIQGVWNGFVGFFTGLPNRIAGAVSGMFHGITDAFRGALNGMIDLWNRLHFTLPKINAGPIHVGGGTIGVPHIPHLAAGGLMTSDGLVYAHAGEVITPAPGPRGPAVHIEHATFAEPVDIDLFMARVAFSMRKARV